MTTTEVMAGYVEWAPITYSQQADGVDRLPVKIGISHDCGLIRQKIQKSRMGVLRREDRQREGKIIFTGSLLRQFLWRPDHQVRASSRSSEQRIALAFTSCSTLSPTLTESTSSERDAHWRDQIHLASNAR